MSCRLVNRLCITCIQWRLHISELFPLVSRGGRPGEVILKVDVVDVFNESLHGGEGVRRIADSEGTDGDGGVLRAIHWHVMDFPVAGQWPSLLARSVSTAVEERRRRGKGG